MKTIKIAHLYYDLMNLYGESGNIRALVEGLKKQGVKCEVDLLTKGSKINFSKYEIFYMGMGTERNQEIVRKDILRYKEEIKKNIKTKTFIMTGNAYELFGASLNDLECLNIFNFKSKSVRGRIVGEESARTYTLKNMVIGFQNRGSINDNTENHFLEIVNGHADNKDSKFEGIHIDNFYGTYNLGPLLIRNPELTDKIIENILTKYNYPFTKDENSTDYLAYNEYIKNFH